MTMKVYSQDGQVKKVGAELVCFADKIPKSFEPIEIVNVNEQVLNIARLEDIHNSDITGGYQKYKLYLTVVA